MFLTIDNPVALPSDGEGLRAGGGTGSESAGGGHFGQILSSQEAKPTLVDQAAELPSLLAQDSSSGTLLPGGGKEVPSLAGSETGTADFELIGSFQSPIAEVAEEALSPPLLNPPVNELASEQPSEVAKAFATPGLEQSLSKLAVSDQALEPIEKPVPPPIAGITAKPSGAESLSAASVPVLGNPQLPLQPAGQKLESNVKADRAISAGLSSAVDSRAPIVQKPDITLAIQDASVELTETLKAHDVTAPKSVGSNALNSAAPLPPGFAQTVNETNLSSALRPTSLTTLPTAVGDTNWNQEFVGRIGVLVDKGVSEAKLQLTPAELGRMEIKITTEGDQAKILFTVQNATAREAIEQAMPRLREMLEQEGMQLAHSEVADQSATRDDNRNLKSENLAADSTGQEEELDDFLPRSVAVTANTMVDYYV